MSASDCLLCSDFMMGPSFHSTYYYMRVFCWLLCYDFREGLPRCYLPIFQAKGYWSYPRPARNTLCAMGAGERTPWTRHRHTGGGTGRGTPALPAGMQRTGSQDQALEGGTQLSRGDLSEIIEYHIHDWTPCYLCEEQR